MGERSEDLDDKSAPNGYSSKMLKSTSPLRGSRSASSGITRKHSLNQQGRSLKHLKKSIEAR